ncbi:MULTISPECIES: proteasome activator [unclassified Brevibacterium]|uniref:proteasome activator n=1 Tax=unclassified Brevibacterium TaxID=2614124 RepID=UPI0036337071
MTADATPTAPGAADPQRAQDGPQNVQSDEQGAQAQQGAQQNTGTEATGSSADRAGVPVTADSEADQAGLARGETLTDAASHPDPATAARTGDTRTAEPAPASATGSEPDADPETEADSEAEAAEEGDIASPGKVMRIGTMVKQLLEEVRSADLDEKGRQRLAEIHRRAIAELEDGLSAELVAELGRLDLPFDSTDEPPSTSELRIAQSQLVGWLEGLFHGIQTAIMAQQAMAKQETPPPGGLVPPGAQAGSAAEGTDDKRRTGNYL